MFSDPQSITVATVAKTLPRVSSGDFKGQFRGADGAYELLISHDSGKKDRSMARINSRKIGANPLDPSKNVPYTAGAYVVLEAPAQTAGFSSTELEDLLKALVAYLTPANISKFVGKES